MDINKADREISIYWDYDNVSLPQWCGPGEAAKKIHSAVSKYGHKIVEQRLYYDFQKHRVAGLHDCSGMDLSGFDLVDTPTRNWKVTLDKKLIADVLTFAWGCSARNAKPCVVLITSDGDYAYTLSKLQDRGVMSIVMYGKDCSATQILVENADVALRFSQDVLDLSLGSERANTVSKPAIGCNDRACIHIYFKNLPALVNARDFVQFIEQKHGVIVQRVILNRPPNLPYSFAHVQFANVNDGTTVLNVTNNKGLTFRGSIISANIDANVPTSALIARIESDCCYVKQPRKPTTWPRGAFQRAREREVYQTTEMVTAKIEDVTKCCVCLHNEQLYGTMGHSTKDYEKYWVPMSPFVSSLRNAVVKSLPKRILVKSNLEGYIAIARQKLDTEGGYVGVSWHKNQGLHGDLSKEAYLRLTTKGRILVQTIFQKKKVDEFLGSRTKEPSEVSSISIAERSPNPFTCPNPSTLTSDSGVFLHFTNLPNATNVNDFVDFIESTYHTPVERAVVCPCPLKIDNNSDTTADTGCSKCCAYLHIITPRRGLTIAILALTEGITFNGIKIKFNYRCDFATMSEKMTGSEDNKLCYLKTEHASIRLKKLLALPNTTSEAEDTAEIYAKIEEADFCTYLLREQKKVGNMELLPCDQCWVASSSALGSIFRSTASCCDLSKKSYKDLLKVTREISIHDGLIEIGRRRMSNRGYVSIPWFDNRGENESLSQEFYMRLTDAGISLFQSKKVAKKGHQACVFLQNLFWPAQVSDLVRFLEVEFHAVVRRASIEYHDSNEGCSAHVEFAHAEDGVRICRDDKPMHYLGRKISICTDNRVPPEGSVIEKNPSLFYMKKVQKAKHEVCQSVVNEAGQSATEGSNYDAYDNGVVAPETVVVANHADTSSAITGGSSNSDDVTAIRSTGVNNPSFDNSVISKNIDIEHFLAASTEQEDDVNVLANLGSGGGSSPGVDTVGPKRQEVSSASSTEEKMKILYGHRKTTVETHPSKLDILKKELDEAVQTKDFSRAGTVQTDIERLENEKSSDIESNSLMRSALEDELNVAVEVKQFDKAAMIQSRIEELEEGTLNGDEVKVLLRKYLDKELDEAVNSRDFAKAGTIQARIERLEQKC